MLIQTYFSIDSLSTPWSHDQYSELRFKQQPSATDKSTLKIWKKKKKTRYINVNQLSPSVLARNKISYKKKNHPSGPFPLIQKYLEELWGKENGEGGPKQNKRLLKTLLEGQLSMECTLVFRLPTHAEHQKLGLSLSPILTGSGYCGATGAVLNSNTLCLCGMHKHQHKLIKQKGESFLLVFRFLESYFKTLKSGTI